MRLNVAVTTSVRPFGFVHVFVLCTVGASVVYAQYVLYRIKRIVENSQLNESLGFICFTANVDNYDDCVVLYSTEHMLVRNNTIDANSPTKKK